ELAFAALAERQAGNLDAVTFLHMQRDRAARAPNEIAGMRRDHQARFASIAHDRDFLLRVLHVAGRTGRVTIVWQFLPARSHLPICRYRPSGDPEFPRENWPWPRSRDRARA